MNSEWQKFLSKHGAVIEHDQVIAFGAPEQERKAALGNTILADLSAYGLIKVSGEDRVNFLQNLFSNDIKEITPERSQLNAWCNPKGRMLASLRVFQIDDDYFLQLSADLLETTLKRLRMYVLRSKVTLEDVSDEWACLGLAGETAPRLLAGRISHPPEKNHQLAQEKGLTVIRLAGDTPRFQICARTADLIPLWQALEAEATPVGYPVWNWLEIRAGVPNIVAGTSEAFVPQMVNYATIGGVSFTKCCYPGQEVVARMHYLGKLKRRMYLAHIDADTPPEAGENLFPAGETEQSCGKVVQAQNSPEGGVDLLAVLQIAAAENDEIHLGSASGPQLQLQKDPYPVDNKA